MQASLLLIQFLLWRRCSSSGLFTNKPGTTFYGGHSTIAGSWHLLKTTTKLKLIKDWLQSITPYSDTRSSRPGIMMDVKLFMLHEMASGNTASYPKVAFSYYYNCWPKTILKRAWAAFVATHCYVCCANIFGGVLNFFMCDAEMQNVNNLGRICILFHICICHHQSWRKQHRWWCRDWKQTLCYFFWPCTLQNYEQPFLVYDLAPLLLLLLEAWTVFLWVVY